MCQNAGNKPPRVAFGIPPGGKDPGSQTVACGHCAEFIISREDLFGGSRAIGLVCLMRSEKACMRVCGR